MTVGEQRFVLDENVINRAHCRLNAHDQPDETCMHLLLGIWSKRLGIVMAADFWGWYAQQVRDLVRQRVPIPLGMGAMTVLNLILRESDQTVYLSDADLTPMPELDGMSGVDAHDAVFVRAAASVEDSVLVTTDGPLLGALERESIPARHRFSAEGPSDALARVQSRTG